jgi:arginine deiminase
MNYDKRAKIGVNSEYGKLREVIIQPPGPEQDKSIPWDGIHPHLESMPISSEEALKEYMPLMEFLIEELGEENVHVTRNLLAETIGHVDGSRLSQIFHEIAGPKREPYVKEFLGKIATNEAMQDPYWLASKVITGYPDEIIYKDGRIEPTVFTPKRTLMWSRDSIAATPVGMIMCSMAKKRRFGESAIMSSIFKYHPHYGEQTIAVDLPELERQDGKRYILEGGNVQVYRHIVALGTGHPDNDYASRSNKDGLEKVTRELFAKDTEGKIEQIMHVYLPDLPINIHLDSVFNIDGPGSAIAMPYIFRQPDIPEKYYGALRDWFKEEMIADGEDPSKLPRDEDYAKDFKSAGINVQFIQHLVAENILDLDKITWIGDASWVSPQLSDPNIGDFTRALKEQADMGGNIFCTGPFRLVTYGRNDETVASIYRKRRQIPESREPLGKIIEIPSRELRGTTSWGGPHCMVAPIFREPI